MGLLRLLFALSVANGHAGMLFNYNIVNSYIAVLSFFIISGFYMAMILDKKYTGKSTFLFLSNRFLRIFPLYWTTLFIMFLLSLVKFVFHIGTPDSAIAHYIHWAPNTTPFIATVDLLNYISRNLTLIFTIDYFRMSNNFNGYLIVQQAWTLQIELLFYLLVPFLVRLSTKKLLIFSILYALIFFGFVDRFNLLEHNLIYSFLRNLILFLFGMMSYQLLFKRLHVRKPYELVTLSISVLFISYVILYNVLPFQFTIPVLPISDLFFYIFLFFSLPFIFLQTSSSIMDGLMGKLSYPVYISHLFVIKLFANLPFFHNTSSFEIFTIIILSLIVSFFMVKLIESPIDKYRQARLKVR